MEIQVFRYPQPKAPYLSPQHEREIYFKKYILRSLEGEVTNERMGNVLCKQDWLKRNYPKLIKINKIPRSRKSSFEFRANECISAISSLNFAS